MIEKVTDNAGTDLTKDQKEAIVKAAEQILGTYKLAMMECLGKQFNKASNQQITLAMENVVVNVAANLIKTMMVMTHKNDAELEITMTRIREIVKKMLKQQTVIM